MCDLQRSDFMLIGGRIPDELVALGLWDLSQLRWIVTTEPSRNTPPKSWKSQMIRIRHAKVGGVSDAVSSFTLYTRQNFDVKKVLIKEQGAQDLRWVLKAGKEGFRTAAPPFANDTIAQDKVIFVKDKVVSAMGLFPAKKPEVKVHTEFGGNSWVIREPTIEERLMIQDVPEKLVRLLDSKERELLLKHSNIPGKTLHGILSALISSGDMSPKISLRDLAKGSDGLRRGIISNSVAKYEDSMVASLVVNSIRKKSGTALTAIAEEMEVDEHDEELSVFQNLKATKNDDAAVRTELWDKYLIIGLDPLVRTRNISHACKILRRWLLNIWRKNVKRSYVEWEASSDLTEEELIKSRTAAEDCFDRCDGASWWAWDAGSRPFFWRWPKEYQTVVRDGLPPWFVNPVTTWRRRQRPPRHSDRMKMIQEKLMVVRNKKYVGPGNVLSLMSFFEVPKGDSDVRMVYDGTASGLNDEIWAPWFPLPTVDCLVRSLEPGYSMADNDVGEMFHNYILHDSMRKYCGLDLTLYFPEELEASGSTKLWERWERLAMGLRISPYAAVQGMMFAEEVILGNKDDSQRNIFHWDRVRLNLPGSSSYDPSKSWVCKVRKDGSVAADIFTYVDDIRSCAPTRNEAWKASQQTSSTLGFLGIQDAARKRRDPGEETGAWTGSVVWTTNDEVSVMTSQDKWDRTRDCLQWIQNHLKDSQGLNLKTLQSYRGFLVYVARTYPSFVPYLKGLHSTIDSWRPGRDEDGWKYRESGRSITKQQSKTEYADEDEMMQIEHKFGIEETVKAGEPKFVKPVPRLFGDIQSLVELASSATPPKRCIRMKSKAQVIYGFGDASKKGFGTTIELPNKDIYWKHGQWVSDKRLLHDSAVEMSFVAEKSSNYRELHNLVIAIEEAFDRGWLDGHEIFMFTDNSTAESAYYKGTSSSKSLFELVLRLRKIEVSGVCKLHLIHVAGTRMIWQGTDGLSRGDFTSGVMAGDPMVSFVPLHLSAFDRDASLPNWIRKSMLGINLLDGECYRELHHDDWPTALVAKGIYVWSPPPAAAGVAAEWLAKSIHKRPHSTHIFVCPRLMTSVWLRVVNKLSDLVVVLPLATPVWGREQHEPLILAIALPLSRSKPWRYKSTPYIEHVRKVLLGMFESDFDRTGAVLCECISHARNLASV